MWLRIVLTACALAFVLYLQFGFNIKTWIQENSAAQEQPSEVPPSEEKLSP